MKSRWYALLALLFAFTLNATARDTVLPAGTLLQCTLNEPNFSTATALVGDPVLCHLRGLVEFGEQAFPRGSYLVGHLEAAKNPGHFVGKGYLEFRFDRIGLPSGDMPIEAKIIFANKYKVDRAGKIDGKGHAKRDAAEWMFPPLWPWKVLMLPARGPRPRLKGESVFTLRLMEDVEVADVARNGSGNLSDPEWWHSFGQPQSQSYRAPDDPRTGNPETRRAARGSSGEKVAGPQISYATYSKAAAPDLFAEPEMPVFVLKTGAMLVVSGYAYRDKRIRYVLATGGFGSIGVDEIDWATTAHANEKRGVRITLYEPPAGTP
jgi:hypothetical protein